LTYYQLSSLKIPWLKESSRAHSQHQQDKAI
jgi:hypothetical protein